MSDDGTPLPEPDNAFVTDSYHEPWMDIPTDRGEYSLRIAETIEKVVETLEENAGKRMRLDEEFHSGEELDYENIHLMIDVLPYAMEDLGERVEEARNIVQEINDNRSSHTSNAPHVEIEHEWMENYRELEKKYRSIFDTLEGEVNGETLSEYMDDRYSIDVYHDLESLPAPRLDNR